MSTDISLIGLGPMGIALGKALLAGGKTVTVWNRSLDKAGPLVAEGAALAPSVAAAIDASPVVLVCVATYDASNALLDAPEVAKALTAKLLVQLSTGTPEDARDGERRAQAAGADYLDGAIMATPGQMGRPDTTILLSGAQRHFERAEPLLKPAGGNLMYVGEPAGAAAAWDLATLAHMFGAMFGFFHGVRILESEKMRVDAFAEFVGQIAPAIGEMVRSEGVDIHAEHYDEPGSSMLTCANTGVLFRRNAREAGIDDSFPQFAGALFDRAMQAGYGPQRLASMIKVLRG